MNFTIHKADKRHLPEINRLIVETKIGEPMDKLEGNFWFAKINGKIIGCGGVQLIGNSAGIVIHLAVEKAYRKKGICSSILKEIDNFVKRQGTKTLSGNDVLSLQFLQKARL